MDNRRCKGQLRVVSREGPVEGRCIGFIVSEQAIGAACGVSDELYRAGE